MLGVGAITACALVTSLDDLGGGASDAQPDTPIVLDAPAGGCALSVSPSRVVLDPGDTSLDVTVSLARGTGVTGAATIAINGLPPQVTASSLTIPAASGTFSVAVLSNASLQTVAATIVASIGMVTCDTPWQLVIGSVITAMTTSGTFTVPTSTTSVIIDAWGAGGGSTPAGFNAAIQGGGGGFVEATVDVTPSESLAVTIGKGGGAGAYSSDAGQTGAGGGGYTAVARGSTYLVIAGSGGGGGFDVGGGGGGTSGESADAGGGGGTQSNGGQGGFGGKNGSSLQGGTASCGQTNKCTVVSNGGAPGGGNGATCNSAGFCSGGGGGAGFFGGGGGPAGGGGGSGFAEVKASNVTLLTASGATPPNTSSSVYTSPAGLGGNPKIASAGSDGRVVFVLPKWKK